MFLFVSLKPVGRAFSSFVSTGESVETTSPSALIKNLKP